MTHSISRRAAVKYALATVVSLATAPFTWFWAHNSQAGSRQQLMDRLTSDLTPTTSVGPLTMPVQTKIHPVCDDRRVTERCSLFLQNAYYLSHEGRFHQPILEATRAFRTDHAIQLTLQERFTSSSSSLL